MKLLSFIVAIMLAVATAEADSKKPSSIQWKPEDCSSSLMLPENQFDVSQYGRGQYRIDGAMSQGHFNCIYITFQATNSLVPVSVSGARESTFTIKEQKVTWRTYQTVVEGRSVIRKEALLPNILPREKRGNGSDYIWIRIDADSQQIIDQLTPVAEGILQDAA
ncbi:MAG: hypothetical protein HYV35_01155 [Lentisphaerae bacterium]|nr:hypothetical protein [Lentisphaerota bacterium]